MNRFRSEKGETGMNFQVIEDAKITSPKGFSASGTACGLKQSGELDLGLIYCETPATSAAVYTTNSFQAAPLLITQNSLSVEGKLQAVIVNSGNANACTGERGLQDADQMRKAVAEKFQISDHLVAVASTGIIGEYLPMDAVSRGIEALKVDQQAGATDFSKAILTTDLTVKRVEVEVEIGGKPVKIAGCAKGSGMIHPNMATLLGFITTDVKISGAALNELLKDTVDDTFNMITVDGDCSTNDMVLVMASGYVDTPVLQPDSPEWSRFAAAFHYVCQELSKQIARDGEGANRLIEVSVQGAKDAAQARKVAKSIVGSNLVKTAIFGRDVNLGRIFCAIGYSDSNIAFDPIELHIGSVPVIQNGQKIDFHEQAVVDEMKKDTVHIYLDLHQGHDSAIAWGCDLSYEYVKINASYRT